MSGYLQYFENIGELRVRKDSLCGRKNVNGRYPYYVLRYLF